MTNIIDLMIGRQILLRRLEIELSQAALSHEVGLSSAMLDALEAGRQRVTNADLKELGGALGVPLSYFFDWDTPPDDADASLASASLASASPADIVPSPDIIASKPQS